MVDNFQACSEWKSICNSGDVSQTYKEMCICEDCIEPRWVQERQTALIIQCQCHNLTQYIQLEGERERDAWTASTCARCFTSECFQRAPVLLRALVHYADASHCVRNWRWLSFPDGGAYAERTKAYQCAREGENKYVASVNFFLTPLSFLWLSLWTNS